LLFQSNDSPYFVKKAIFTHKKAEICLPTNLCFFNEIRPLRVKSPRGEIPLCGAKDGFHFS
jgi:hypothetical protein